MRAAVFSVGLALSCAKPIGPQAPSLVPSASVYLRNSFDTDPSLYLGRFLPSGSAVADEGAAMTLACSQHVSWRFVEGGGVRYTEAMAVSSEAAARLGIPLVAEVRGGASRNATVQVEYTLTGKMIAEIKDPSAFSACCAAQPGQCTDRYVGEFLQGTGVVRHDSKQAAAVSGKGTHPSGASGDGGASQQASWNRVVEFPNPVYFAFKVAQTPHNRVAHAACGDWVDRPPKAEGGRYFVGASKASKTEQQARQRALRNAMMLAWQSQGGAMVNLPEPPEDADDVMEATVEPFPADPVATWAMGIRPDDWCVTTVETSKGPRYEARVLGFLPPYTAP